MVLKLRFSCMLANLTLCRFFCFVKNPFIKDGCFNSTLLQNYDLCGSILMGIGLILSILIFNTSLKGTVINTIPRQHMGKLVFAKVGCFLQISARAVLLHRMVIKVAL